MKLARLGELIGTVQRFARGEGHTVELASILGVDVQVLDDLFHQCNILDAHDKVRFGLDAQEVINVILFLGIQNARAVLQKHINGITTKPK